MQELLKSISSPADLLSLGEPDLAWALLRCMQERQHNPLLKTNAESAVAELFPLGGLGSDNPVERNKIEKKLSSAFRKAFAQLETWGLIEPDEGQNGKNGYVVLTEKGMSTVAQTELEHFRQRRLLAPEMLHPLLHGDVYSDFLAGKPGKAVLHAFKTVEVQVRTAAKLPDKDFGAELMQIAFNEKIGPLTDMSESPSQRKALIMLFAGALGRFRNPEGHLDRVFADWGEAAEELMIASRLLRIVDQRKVP
jgi:uncharacterized protein (TIGR02391 family)